jgi:hypothetical protein
MGFKNGLGNDFLEELPRMGTASVRLIFKHQRKSIRIPWMAVQNNGKENLGMNNFSTTHYPKNGYR